MAIAEHERVSPLSRKQINAVLSALAFYGVEVPIYFKYRPNLKDEDDNMVFECAANFNARFIVTHNVKDFLDSQLRGFTAEPIQPGKFLKILRSKS